MERKGRIDAEDRLTEAIRRETQDTMEPTPASTEATGVEDSTLDESGVAIVEGGGGESTTAVGASATKIEDDIIVAEAPTRQRRRRGSQIDAVNRPAAEAAVKLSEEPVSESPLPVNQTTSALRDITTAAATEDAPMQESGLNDSATTPTSPTQEVYVDVIEEQDHRSDTTVAKTPPALRNSDQGSYSVRGLEMSPIRRLVAKVAASKREVADATRYKPYSSQSLIALVKGTLSLCQGVSAEPLPAHDRCLGRGTRAARG